MATRGGTTAIGWAPDQERLALVQHLLAELSPPSWAPPADGYAVGASYCCGERLRRRGGASAAASAIASGVHTGAEPDERGWAAGAIRLRGGTIRTVVAEGRLTGAYRPGWLALREGPLRETALRRLPTLPDVLIVDAAGRDHPRRAGLALHLGAIVDVPTVGATDRPLLASGNPPADRRGAASPLHLDDELVGYWVRVQPGVRALAVHAGWRTTPEVAVEVVLAEAGTRRTPQVMARAREAARQARSAGPPG